MPDTIRLERRGPVAHVILNRPEVRNAFNAAMILELTGAFREIAAAADVRAVLLSGEGKAFCAGGDLNWMREMTGNSPQENMEDARRLGRMLKAIWECPRPVIARLHGAVYGGGTGVTAAADIALAESGTTFCFSEVRHGLIPAMIAPFVLSRTGESAARRYFLTAEPFDSRGAQQMGLVSEIAEGIQGLDAAVERVIGHLLDNGPEAVSASKRLIAETLPHPDWESVLEMSAAQLTARRASAEAREGIEAFLAKRRPAWREAPEGAA
jgi:methylglutaconyl-CoA hydratase